MISNDRSLPSWLSRRRLLAGDGAMGTTLMSLGLPPDAPPEVWTLDRTDAVESVLVSYVDAGADLIETNTFGASPSRLAAHGLADRCAELNRRAAEIARRAAGDHSLVLGCIGPTGLHLEPLGPLRRVAALDGFARQANALAEGGAEAIIVETMTDLAEAVLAVEAASGTSLPVIACMTFEVTPRGIFTISGHGPAESAKRLADSGAGLLGTNCGTGPSSMIAMVRALRAATDLPILAKPSAGLPEAAGGRFQYPETAPAMASRVASLVEAGASIVGGCCGTTADHVRAMSAEIERIRERLVGTRGFEPPTPRPPV